MTRLLAPISIATLLFPLLVLGEDPKAAAKAGEKTAEKVDAKALAQKASYSFGYNIGQTLKRQGIDLDLDVLMKGLKDAMSGTKPVITETEMMQVMQNFQREQMAKQAELKKTQGEKNKKEGDAFLAENKKKEGVVTLPSGLQYKVLKQGTGAVPKATDKVVTHYKGTLIDGTEFDSSYGRGQPAEFGVTGVIKGWTEALQLMPVGSKWQLYIPSELAYGLGGAPGGKIGPGSTLVFEIELLEIKAAAK